MKRFRWSLFAVTMGVTAIACWEHWRNFSLAPSSVLQGKELVGATLTSFDERGRSLKLKIEDIQPDFQDKDRESYLYTVIYYSATDNSWYPLCQPDSAGINQAIPLTGRWDRTGAYIDDRSITFACTNGALAKCVRWGYKPWKSIKGESLRDYHQAYTRMVRADYCGNGIGHTKDGTPIDVYDRLSIQQRTKKSGMSFEAAWNVDGAVYLNRTRFPKAIAKYLLSELKLTKKYYLNFR
ncbi:MAG: ADYC domain-containing protein [Pleurocapsa sp. MO_226.B13]|nr:ADYC domain-containing protein [Pleurocapsa sp. MO_226.B13]